MFPDRDPPQSLLIKIFDFLKVSAPPISDHERHMQSVIKEKLNCSGLPHPKCKGTLLVEMARELKELKDDLEAGKYCKIPKPPLNLPN